jgi:hypothetical protein
MIAGKSNSNAILSRRRQDAKKSSHEETQNRFSRGDAGTRGRGDAGKGKRLISREGAKTPRGADTAGRARRLKPKPLFSRGDAEARGKSKSKSILSRRRQEDLLNLSRILCAFAPLREIMPLIQEPTPWANQPGPETFALGTGLLRNRHSRRSPLRGRTRQAPNPSP